MKQRAVATKVTTDPATQMAITNFIHMKPHSVHRQPRTGITNATHPSSTHSPGSEALIALIQRATAENRWEDAVVLLNRHPDLFQNHPDITLKLHGLEERHLEDLLLTLHPDVRLPAVCLDRMDLQRGYTLRQLVGRLGVSDLRLHQCTLADQAWKGLTEGVRLCQFQGQSGLSAFSFVTSAPLETPINITQDLTEFLSSITHLRDLTLDRVCLDAAPVFEAMKGKVDHLKLPSLHLTHFVEDSGTQPYSPDVKQLSLKFLYKPEDKNASAPPPSKALSALIANNPQLATLELNCEGRNINDFKMVGTEVTKRQKPLSVRLSGSIDKTTESAYWAFLLSLKESLVGNKSNVKSLYVSKLRKDDVYMIMRNQGLEELSAGSVEPGFTVKKGKLDDVLADMLRFSTLRMVDVPPASANGNSASAPQQPERDDAWAPMLNALFSAQANFHFLKSHSLRCSEVSLPPEMTPALLDLPARPLARTQTPGLQSVKLVNRESYNTWVDSVEKARAELPPSSSRFVPALTRLPTDNG